jgi:hypothetical protein
MSEHVMIGVVVMTIFGSMTFLLISIANAVARSKRDKQMAEVSAKLIDRLSPGADVLSFVNSEAYKSILGGEQAGRASYAARILNTLQSGVVLLCAGIGMFVVSNFTGTQDFGTFMRVVGGIVIAIGIGLSLSAGWSYVLLKKWGLIPEATAVSQIQ